MSHDLLQGRPHGRVPRPRLGGVLSHVKKKKHQTGLQRTVRQGQGDPNAACGAGRHYAPPWLPPRKKTTPAFWTTPAFLHCNLKNVAGFHNDARFHFFVNTDIVSSATHESSGTPRLWPGAHPVQP
eukprot:scaffold67343_cov60-Phaeocystis_antarctica.AAC.1